MNVAECMAPVPYTGRGVVYFSSVPRNMRPVEVRLHYSKYGHITRMRFVAYPKKERRPGGPLLPLQYKEGWLEFARASDAAAAARAMNATPVECKRQRRCYGQLWTVKYLDGFAWDSLAESREAARRQRRMAEADARRAERDVNEAYRRLAMQARERRGTKRTRNADDADDEETAADTTTPSAAATAVVAASAPSARPRKRVATARKAATTTAAAAAAVVRRKRVAR